MKCLLFSGTVLLLCINFYFSQNKNSCEAQLPVTVADCGKLSTSQNSCCFYKKDGARLCKWWDSKVVKTVISSDEVIYQCDNYRGIPCDPVLPSDPQDCDANSFITNSCCYFKDGDVGRCMWWGEGYKGKSSYLGKEVVCMAYFLKVTLISILVTMLI